MQPGDRSTFGQSRFGQSSVHEGNIEAPSMMEKAADVVSAVGDKAGEMASSVGEKARQLQAAVSEQTEAGATFLQEHGKSFLNETTCMIRRNPIPSLLISFGVGVLLAQVVEGNRR